jgi:Fur family transcriptional regulator, ferric uptake regulator
MAAKSTSPTSRSRLGSTGVRRQAALENVVCALPSPWQNIARPSISRGSAARTSGFARLRIGIWYNLQLANMAATPAHRVSTGERINVHEAPGRLQRELGSRGIRLTRQRRVLLQVMETARRHLDAGEILDRAQKIDSNITRVTVYRTIDLLKRHGLIDELDLLHLRGDRHFYESHGPRDHIHVACLRCGKVREVESELYEELKQQIARDCGIDITVSRTEIGGVCTECRKQEKQRASS